MKISADATISLIGSLAGLLLGILPNLWILYKIVGILVIALAVIIVLHIRARMAYSSLKKEFEFSDENREALNRRLIKANREIELRDILMASLQELIEQTAMSKSQDRFRALRDYFYSTKKRLVGGNSDE